MRFTHLTEWLKAKSSPLMMRIFIINILGLLLLACFNYATFYNMNTKTYMQSVVAYNQRVSEIAFGNIDQQIMHRAANIPSMYFADIPLNEAVLYPQRVDISASPTQITALTSQMNEISNSFPEVSSIDVLYEGTNTIVSGHRNLHFVQSKADYDRYLPWYRQYEAAGENTLFLPAAANAYPGSENVLTLVTKIQNSRWRGDNIVTAIHILPSSFSEYIDEHQGQLVVTSGSGTILYSTPGKDIPAQQIATAAQKVASAGGNQTQTIQLDELDLVVSCYSDSSLGISYYHATRYDTFFKDYNLHLRSLILNYVLSVLFITGVLFLTSYLNNTAYHKKLMTISKRAGFAVAEKAEAFDRSADAIASQLTSLNSVVEQTRPVLYRNYVRSLILGRYAGDAYEQLRPLMAKSGFFCFIIHLTPADSLSVQMDILGAILTKDAQDYSLLLTTLEKNEIAVVVSVEYECLSQVRTHLNQCFDDLWTGHYAADGQWFPLTEENIKAAFDSTLNIYRYHFIFPEKSRLHYDTIGQAQSKNSGSHLKLFAEIEKDILSENLLDLKRRLYALAESFQFGTYSIDYCSSTLRDLVTMLYNITQSQQLDMWVAFGYDIRAHYKQIGDIDEFYRWSCDLCEVLMQNIRQRKKGLPADLQSRIVQLIDKNLENDISLEFLADSLLLRPDVLSRTFKQLMGTSYSSYTKDKKLTRAKVLIAEGHSMKDISQQLGYNSTQYFIKIFKETYGITPYQYKKNGMPSQ